MLNSDSKSSSVSSKGYGLLDNEEPLQKLNGERKNNAAISVSKNSLPQNHDTKEEKSNEKSDQEQPVNFFALFKYSNTWDKLLMIVGFIVAVFSGALWPLVMILFGNFIDQFVNHAVSNATDGIRGNRNASDREDFLQETAELSMYNAFLGILLLVISYIIICSFSLSAANQAHKIRCLFMASVLKQDIAWFDTHQTGDFASRMTGDLNKIEDGIGEKIGICISFLSTTLLCTVCGLYYGWKLALVTLSVTPILTVAMGILTKVQAAVTREESEAYGAAGAVAEEALSSIRTVVAFGGEQKEIQRYDKCLAPARKKGIKRGFMTSIGSGLTWFCIFAGYALAFWYGVKLIVDDKNNPNPEYTAGTLLIVFSNIMTASMFFGQTAPYFEAFALARGAAAKIFSVTQRKPDIDSSSKLGEKPDELDGSITFTNVYFNYPARPDVPVLKGISLAVQSGETIALVGSSGCGKSTIIQLILRFYDTVEGSVEIDENNVKVLNVGWLRSNIGFVGQEPVLFSTTIAENIRYGKNDATLEEIEEASKLANVHDFISNLPLKYETLVGDRGTQLSGGQKQRIAVARALIKNPKILLLDEATSALDTESEAIVQSALDQARKGRTTIIVAHRLSTIRNADKIYVLSDGMIKEMGSHDELMERKELYYQLVLSQMSEIDDECTEDMDESRHTLKHQTSVLSSSSVASVDSIQDTLRRRTSTLISYDEEKGLRYVFKDVDEDESSLSWIRLLKTSLPEWPYLVIGAICSLIMGIHTPLYGIVFGSILGVLSEDADKILEDNAFYCLLFLLMAVTSFTCSFLQVFLFSVAAEKLTSRLRKMVFCKIITQDIAWFDHPKNSVGSLCAKLTSDAADMQGATGSRISTLLQTLSTFVACLFLALHYNYKIGSLVFAFVPLILLSVYLEGRLTAGQMLNDKTSTEAASKIAIEAIESIRTVASLHQEENFFIQFRNALVQSYSNARRKSHVKAIAFAFAQSIQVFAYSAAFYYGSVLVAAGELHYSDLYKVLEGIVVSTAILGQAVAFAPDYHKAKIAAVRIFKLLDIKPTIDVFSPIGSVLENVDGNIDFQSVYFNYPSRPKVKVLRGLNLNIEPGKTIALVGSSGCGKSTCVQLIERFYEVDKGDVLVDDVNVKDINVKNLRSHIGLVSQEPVLFSYSIAENIAYGKNFEDVDMNEIIDAAKKANIHNFITSLPQGYETPVGMKGTQLSGGQKQRVAIARALLRDPKILLLDEATSALDAESERIVQEALDNARSGRTCLVIAHRLTTIQNADSIAVIHKGRIVEQGTHQELLKIKGHYYNLYNSQYSKKNNAAV
ncbi:ATP-dependent translocase ABCB1 like protein [Argiope bruennichi]|uniref:ABC-type xenobiotic transporter n=1 Tax=Argiope bruennichi TaxID=94029 RepID=A0A8T0E8T2_ARGBR|nr:ATP-dependent translocase ABCB1 like protein [Argiope bruennichi]